MHRWDSGDSEAISNTAGAGGEARDEASADATGADGDGGGGGEAAMPLAVDTVAVARARDVVRTGTMELTVEDVDASATDVRRLAADAGGFVADEQVRAREGASWPDAKRSCRRCSASNVCCATRWTSRR